MDGLEPADAILTYNMSPASALAWATVILLVVKLAPDVKEISKPDGGVTLKSPVRLEALIVYCSSAELVLAHSAKAPSPEANYYQQY